MITFSFKVFFMERITSTAYLKPLDFEGQVHTLPREWIPILQTSETIMLNILCFSWVEEETSTQNGGTDRFSFWPQLRKLGFHPWPDLIFVTNITNYICGEKIAMWRIFSFPCMKIAGKSKIYMWRNFRCLPMTDVEKSEILHIWHLNISTCGVIDGILLQFMPFCC